MRTYNGTIGQGRTWVVGILAAILGTLAIAGSTLRGQTTEPAPSPAPEAAAPVAPADPPATAPAATAPMPVPPPVPLPPPPAPKAAAPEFSEDEVILLGSIRDGDDKLVTTPLNVLLKHAAMLRDDAKAEKLSLSSLWEADPQAIRERLKPVAFEGWYAGKCEAKEIDKEDWLPSGTFYLMHIKSRTDRDAPIALVALTKAPPTTLRIGDKLSFTGYFYKNALLPLAKDESTKKTNPVLVAKSVDVGELESSGGRSPFNTWGLIAAIITLLGLGIYFQMRVRAHKQQAAMQERVHAVTHQPEEDADFDIDPDLQQEVERFEAEQEAAHHPKDPA